MGGGGEYKYESVLISDFQMLARMEIAEAELSRTIGFLQNIINTFFLFNPFSLHMKMKL